MTGQDILTKVVKKPIDDLKVSNWQVNHDELIEKNRKDIKKIDDKLESLIF